jgi:hypothetical protein
MIRVHLRKASSRIHARSPRVWTAALSWYHTDRLAPIGFQGRWAPGWYALAPHLPRPEWTAHAYLSRRTNSSPALADSPCRQLQAFDHLPMLIRVQRQFSSLVDMTVRLSPRWFIASARWHLPDTYPDSSSCLQAVTTRTLRQPEVADAGGGEREPPIRSFRRDSKYVSSPTSPRHKVSQLPMLGRRAYPCRHTHDQLSTGGCPSCPAPTPHVLADMPHPVLWSTIYVHRQ